LQSLPLTTNVVSSNPAHGEVYLIQHYVIKFASDLRLIEYLQINLQNDNINISLTKIAIIRTNYIFKIFGYRIQFIEFVK
jgi:hypothetical protein